MSDIIRLLPDNVANQIAAGEVVQRPASIVKELMENAIDAGATEIEVIIKDGGRTLIQVTDNGAGMSDTDARLAFERHATSKIRTTEDIFRISTKGFRGEALASIAAVAEVELRTKTEAAVLGTKICIQGGALVSQEPTQCPVGANFLVKNLFYNVPARRKFLKNDTVETRHIMDEFHRVALAHPLIEFSFYNNDSQIFRLRKGSENQRIVDIFGRRLQPLLVPVQEDVDWIKLHGFVGKPEAAKKQRGEQFFFVNGRYFKSPYLSRAVQEAFDGLLQPQYIPSYFLYLEIDPSRIDVNIHPQKTEVKFEEENVIFALLRSTVKKSLGIYNVAPSLDFDRNPLQDELLNGSASPSSRIPMPSIHIDRSYNPFLEEQQTPKPAEMVNLTEMYKPNIEAAPSKINLFDEDEFDNEMMRLPNGYWLYNYKDSTYMLDLSRIHQVVLAAQRQARSSAGKSQKLLFSHDLFLNEMEKLKYYSVREKLLARGFELNLDEGGHTLHVHAAPENLPEKDIVPLLEKIFSDPDDGGDFDTYYDHRLSRLQRKSKFDFVRQEDVEELLEGFIELGFPEYTHTKKRCYIELPIEELRNKIKN
ncbi:MAG: DNA mismatch repair endonuclease MutL [Chryseobacterium sp.]|nr:MAG: DNA mismatch repair endonuclease MutL [Chryseobacterium sp.]